MYSKHFLKFKICGFFSAPHTPVQPVPIKPDTECIEIITGGAVYHTVGNKEQEFGRGTIFWHQYGETTIYRTPPGNPYRCIYIHFTTDGSPRLFPRITQWNSAVELSSFVEDIIYFQQNNMCDDEKVFAYVLGVMLRQQLPDNKGSLPQTLQQICRLLEHDPAQDIDVDQIADFAGISKSHLFTLFKKHLNSSPHRYLLDRRMLLAKELLANRPDMPVKQVAESCGFKTIEIFYRRFRQYIGCSPASFRLKHLE